MVNNIVIVNAYGRSNRGDSVLLDECISEIRVSINKAKISGAVFEGVETLHAVHPNIDWSERIGNAKKKGLIGRSLAVIYIIISIISTISIFEFLINLLPKSQKITWLKIKKSDMVVSAPGGYIHDTNFAFYIALLHIWLGIKFGKKVVLAPQSIGPIDSKIGKFISKSILKKCTVICARESYTYNFLKNDLHINDKIIKKTGDSAFWNFEVSNDFDEISDAKNYIGLNSIQKNIFGLTVVDWNFPKSTISHTLLDNYKKNIIHIIDYFSFKYDLQTVIFNQVSDDLDLAKSIADGCKSQVLVDDISREPHILRALISESTVFLGTRFHSCIFSMMAGRPTYAIAYLPKTSFILDDLNLLHRQISIDNVDVEKVIEQIEFDLNNLSFSECEILNAIETYRKNYSRLSDILRGII